MIINPNILRKDLIDLLQSIDDQIKEVDEVAQQMGVPREKMRDANGNWPMVYLLSAKIQGLAALVQLNEREKKK